jgi:hypothetical protein
MRIGRQDTQREQVGGERMRTGRQENGEGREEGGQTGYSKRTGWREETG